MNPRSYQEMRCRRFADECRTQGADLSAAWQRKEATALLEKAIETVAPDQAGLTRGELALIEGIRAAFAAETARDDRFPKIVHDRMGSLAADLLKRTGTSEIFGFIEDFAQGKPTATKARAKRIYRQFYPEAKARPNGDS